MELGRWPVVEIEVKPLVEDEVKPILLVLQRIVEVETVEFVTETFVDEILVELVLVVNIGRVVVETWDIDTELSRTELGVIVETEEV
jgi:hypothetical protein